MRIAGFRLVMFCWGFAPKYVGASGLQLSFLVPSLWAFTQGPSQRHHGSGEQGADGPGPCSPGCLMRKPGFAGCVPPTPPAPGARVGLPLCPECRQKMGFVFTFNGLLYGKLSLW